MPLTGPFGMLGADFQVHEPPELVTHLRVVADRLVRATGAAPDAARP